jgi:hypothetical protein
MRQVFWVSAIGLCCVWSSACDDMRRGKAGESCTSANDCGTGLACVALVCMRETDAGASASCDARRDCAAGLTCIANACQPGSVGMPAPGTRYGGQGESCQAKNDCAEDLSCVSNVCRQVSVPLSRVAKNCYRVECANKNDCCAGFVPKDSCPTYKQNCETDPVFCNTYRSLCECNQDCVDELCVAAPAGCMSNAECTSMQTPFCMQGKCRQCDKDSACTGDATKCVAGVCMAACRIDENCALLQKCQDGACVDTGCMSDRECAFMSAVTSAVCREGKCQTPCTADSDCKSTQSSGADDNDMIRGPQICEKGQCVFVGCESDAECRALLKIESSPGNVRAVCR